MTETFCLCVSKAYHSNLMVAETRLVGNMALLPIKTQFKGPARGDGKANPDFFPPTNLSWSCTAHIHKLALKWLFAYLSQFLMQALFLFITRSLVPETCISSTSLYGLKSTAWILTSFICWLKFTWHHNTSELIVKNIRLQNMHLFKWAKLSIILV